MVVEIVHHLLPPEGILTPPNLLTAPDILAAPQSPINLTGLQVGDQTRSLMAVQIRTAKTIPEEVITLRVNLVTVKTAIEDSFWDLKYNFREGKINF